MDDASFHLLFQSHIRDSITCARTPKQGAVTLSTIGTSQYEGCLHIKHGKNPFKQLKRRFVSITNGCLYIFSNGKVKHVYQIKDFQRVSEQENDDKFILTFKDANRKPIVCSSPNRKEWIEQINKAVSGVRLASDSGFDSHGNSFVDKQEFEMKVVTEECQNKAGSNFSEDESKRDELNTNKKGSHLRLRTKNSMGNQTGAWQKCHNESLNFEYDAKKLLFKGTLPDQKLFLKICTEYSRKSEIIRYICNGICQYLKSQSKNIVHIWPAYWYNNDVEFRTNRIVFVVITTTKIEIKSEYRVYQRTIHEISEVNERENRSVRKYEKSVDISVDDITLCLKTEGKQLMENHKNLTWITVSRVKSSGHAYSESNIVKLPCIALYVQVKGLIPIEEDPFEQFIGGYPVDVREGVFMLCGSPTDLHKNIRMGCALDSGFGTNQGTIGPFFKYVTDSYTYFLTSAHVLLDKEEMEKLIAKERVNYGMLGIDTYQPPESISVAQKNTRHHLGKLEFAVYRKGELYKPGMEVALVRIDNSRIPIEGKFPTDETNDDFELSDEEFSLTALLNDPYVYKFGSVTRLTKGRVRLHGSSVKTNTLNDSSLGVDITLHEQIEVESVDDVPFGELGDSGSLVFRKDGVRLTAFGIFEGKIENTYIVTPIVDVKRVLSEFISLNRDRPTDTQMDINEVTSALTMNLFYVPPSYNTPLYSEIDRRISAEIKREATELQANILRLTEHKIESVKAELTAIKRHMDSNFDNTNEKIGGISSQIRELSEIFANKQ